MAPAAFHAALVALQLCALVVAEVPTGPLSSVHCPSVYIYPKVPMVDTNVKAAGSGVATVSKGPAAIKELQAFGLKQRFEGMYKASQFNLALLMLYRMQHSTHCRQVRDPTKADLFVIPVFMNPKEGSEWGRLCENADLWGSDRVEGPDGYTLRFLPYLNESTASRHIFFISKGHYVVTKGEACAWIRGEAPAAPFHKGIQASGWRCAGLLLGPPHTSQRCPPPPQVFAYSHTYADRPYGTRLWDKKGSGIGGRPQVDGKVVSVPYPPWIHWTKKEFLSRPAPWQRFDDRPTRIHYVAGMHGRQADLRKKLFDGCKEVGEPTCRALSTFGDVIMEQKQHSVFCLEPEGDSPFRKSVYDSIVSGCIPGEWKRGGGGFVGRLEGTSAGRVRAQGARRESHCC